MACEKVSAVYLLAAGVAGKFGCENLAFGGQISPAHTKIVAQKDGLIPTSGEALAGKFMFVREDESWLGESGWNEKLRLDINVRIFPNARIFPWAFGRLNYQWE